jgi:hypothetical protein
MLLQKLSLHVTSGSMLAQGWQITRQTFRACVYSREHKMVQSSGPAVCMGMRHPRMRASYHRVPDSRRDIRQDKTVCYCTTRAQLRSQTAFMVAFCYAPPSQCLREIGKLCEYMSNICDYEPDASGLTRGEKECQMGASYRRTYPRRPERKTSRIQKSTTSSLHLALPAMRVQADCSQRSVTA